MMDSAKEMEVQRRQRLEISQRQEAEENKRELEIRMQRLEKGDVDLRSSLHNDTFAAAPEMSAADMIKRNRAFVQRGGGDGFMSR
jgi:predicted transcriptional regulator